MKKNSWPRFFSILPMLALLGCAGNAGMSRAAGAGDLSGDRGVGRSHPGGEAKVSFGEHPAVVLANKYIEVGESHYLIVPYYLYIMGIYSLKHGRHLEEVRHFIVWTFAHLNDSDRWGLSGSIYDYVLCADGTEVSTLQYDSADAYAGMFMILLRDYIAATGDTEFLLPYKDRIFDVAYVMLHLQDEDGLDIAMATYPVKYLMDNSEAYAGLLAFVALARQMRWSGVEDYAAAAIRMKQGVLDHLYDAERKNFYYAMQEGEKSPSDWNNFYPDALSQLFPIYYGIVEADSKLAQRLWREFRNRHLAKVEENIEQKLLVAMLSEKMEGQEIQIEERSPETTGGAAKDE